MTYNINVIRECYCKLCGKGYLRANKGPERLYCCAYHRKLGSAMKRGEEIMREKENRTQVERKLDEE